MLKPKKGIMTRIRWMVRRDIPEVLGIERRSFEFPWTEEDFICYLHQKNCACTITEYDKQIMGFMVYELRKKQLRLLTLAVDPYFRRNGVGSQMINELVSRLSHRHRDRILLETRETNLSSQLFFRAQGFRAVAVLRNFYSYTQEDAYQMQYRLGNPNPPMHIPANRISHLLM